MTEAGRWEQMYQELVKFKEENGHLSVPCTKAETQPLQTWVYSQRQYYRRGALSEERKEKLEKIGFIWNGLLRKVPDLHRNEQASHLSRKQSLAVLWGSRYSELQKLIESGETHIDCRQHRALNSWVKQQKEKLTKGTLKPEYHEMLKKLPVADWTQLVRKGGRRSTKKHKERSPTHKKRKRNKRLDDEEEAEDEEEGKVPETAQPKRSDTTGAATGEENSPRKVIEAMEIWKQRKKDKMHCKLQEQLAQLREQEEQRARDEILLQFAQGPSFPPEYLPDMTKLAERRAETEQRLQNAKLLLREIVGNLQLLSKYYGEEAKEDSSMERSYSKEGDSASEDSGSDSEGYTGGVPVEGGPSFDAFGGLIFEEGDEEDAENFRRQQEEEEQRHAAIESASSDEEDEDVGDLRRVRKKARSQQPKRIVEEKEEVAAQKQQQQPKRVVEEEEDDDEIIEFF